MLLGAPERDAATGSLHNSAFLIDSDGTIVGRCRKINVAADGWSSPGVDTVPMRWRGIRIGCLICADAYTPDVAARLRAGGAEVLISPANWGPGEYGPAGEWERRSRETGLPLIVCNRTGRDGALDFTRAESLVIVAGERRLVHCSGRPAIVTFDWDRKGGQPLGTADIDAL